MEIVIAIVGSAVAIIGSMIALFLWLRSESNNDRRHIQDIQREDRKDLLNLVRAIELEIRDFHHRMIEIEKQR